jgi:hypothetical protein
MGRNDSRATYSLLALVVVSVFHGRGSILRMLPKRSCRKCFFSAPSDHHRQSDGTRINACREPIRYQFVPHAPLLLVIGLWLGVFAFRVEIKATASFI